MRITEQQYPDIWQNIIDDWYDSDMDHRKGQTFYATIYYEVDESIAPDNPELWGFWQTDEGLTWSDNNGLDDKPSSLVKVEQVEETIVVKKWVKVK